MDRPPRRTDGGDGHSDDSGGASGSRDTAGGDGESVTAGGDEAVLFGLTPNGAAALAYAATFLTGLVVYHLADDEFVRFHAAQSVVVFGGLFAVDLLFGALAVTFTDSLSTAIAALAVGLWLSLMLSAVRGRRVRIPLAGRIADAYA
jgi:uncharacterized membrane protein